MNDNRTVLYNALKSEGYTDIGGSQEEFNKLLENPNNLRVAYDAMKNSGYTDIGNDYDEFASLFAVKEQPRGMTKAEPEINGSAWDTYKDVGKIQKPTEPGEKETLTTFGEGVKQGADAIYQGSKYAVGEGARYTTGKSQMVYDDALAYLDERGDKIDGKNFDWEKAKEDDRYARYEEKMELWRKEKEARQEDRKDMGILKKIVHKFNDPSMPDYKDFKETMGEDIRHGQALYAVKEALEEAGGDKKIARQILEKKASEEQWADKTMREASEAMAKHKPVEGAAWWGQMVPQVAGQVVAIGANFIPGVGGVLGKTLSIGTTTGLTMSSAGQAMAEARAAGASEDEIWATGLTQALIEYGSEKIPLDRLIGKMGSAAFKKGYKAVAGNIPEKELEKLLVEGNKRLDGKLLSGKTAKELIKDMGVEGASEFVAEFLGTYVPIIYEDKENYPTLLEAVKNGWEGVKGGFAMGGFLGGGSMVLTNRMQENRRKKQGFVELATDKDGNVVEVIGEKDGLVTVLTQDGATEEHNHEDLNNVGSFTYDEWKNAKVDIEQRENEAAQKKAFAKGYNEPAVNTGDALNVAEQEAKTAMGLNTEESIEDFMDGRSIDEVAMGDEDLASKLNNYFKAKAEDEGRRERIVLEKQRRYAEVDASIDDTANNGVVYSTTLPNGENIVITGGNVVLDDEGYIDVNQSERLVALFPDNTKKPVRPGELREKIEANNAEDLKAVQHAEIDAQIETEFAPSQVQETANETVQMENAENVQPETENMAETATQAPAQAETTQHVELTPKQKREEVAKRIPMKGKQRLWTEADPIDVAEYISLVESDPTKQAAMADGYIAKIQEQQAKLDPIEAAELNDDIAFWNDVKASLAERVRPAQTAESDSVIETAPTIDQTAVEVAQETQNIEPVQETVAENQGGENNEMVEPVGNSEQLEMSVTDNQGNPVDKNGRLIVEEVDTIDDITDADFDAPARNVQLPALPENVATAIGTNGKPVVIKKNVFEKNGNTHVELEPADSREILKFALYNPNIVGATQPIKRPDYKVAIRTGEKNAVVVIDVFQGKDHVEIVGWRQVNEKGLAKMQRQAEREGGQFLILSPNDGSAAALSALPFGLSSESEDRNIVSNEQENTQKSDETAQNSGEITYSQEELAEVKEQLGELNATSAPEFAARLFSIKPWKTLEEANAALKELLASYGETLNGQSLAVMPFLDKAQGLISEYNKIQEPRFVEETLENGDKRTTNYNSRGEVATVALEHDGRIVAVDSYDEGVLFEHTEYDENGVSTSVTRYDKRGNVVATEMFKPVEKNAPKRKVVKKTTKQVMPQTADEFVASVMPKITPESFKRETGLKNGEQRMLVGYIAGADKGGITVEQAAESIMENYGDERRGFGFNGDVQDMRNMIIDILSNGNPKGYIKRSRALREAEMAKNERQMADAWAEGMGFDSYENYLDYTESLLEDIEEQRKEFDETEYYNNLAGNYGYDTTGERKDFGRGGELLQGEQFVTTTPSEVVGEGYEGTAVPGDVRGGGDNALAQGQTSQVNAENINRDDVSQVEVVAEGGNAPGQSGVTGNTRTFADRILAAAEEMRRVPLRQRAQEWMQKVGVPVRIVESLDEVTNKDARKALEAGKNISGWIDNNEVVLYLPNIGSVNEIDATYIHEVVAHKGLKFLMGEKFDALCDAVWNSMSEKARAKYINYPGVNGDTRKAADEYVAHLAEGVNLSEADMSVWQKFVELVKDFITKNLGAKLTDKQIEALIKASYANLKKANAETQSEQEGTKFRIAQTPQEFDATQKEAVEKRGIVAPNLNAAVVNVVDVPRHDFTGNLKEARLKAKEWAIKNYTDRDFDLPDNAGKYVISKNAIGKYLDKSAFDKSDNATVHLSALKVLPEIISNSIEAEIHADYAKGKSGVRNAENGVNRNDLLVHRIYGAVNIDGNTYRVKTTIHEFRDANTANTPHSYEVTKIELIEDSTVTPNDGIDNPLNRSVNSIPATKLLEGVEKSYDKGKKVLDESENSSAEQENDIRFREANKNQEIFVSNARKAVEEIKQEKATPQQWLAMIKKNGGLKAGEDKWMGLSEWLENDEGKSLTKQEVLDFVNENAIKIEEVRYSQFGSGMMDEAAKKLEAETKEIGWDAMQERYPGIEEFFEYYNGEVLWSESMASEGEYEDFILDNKIVDANPADKAINERRESYTTQGLERKCEIALVVPTVEPYNQSDEIHFGDAGEGRAVAWVRFGETTDSEGNRVLVIDEIQSKRHQDARDKGYRGPKAMAEYYNAEDALRVATREKDAYRKSLKEKYGFADFKGSMLERARWFANVITQDEALRLGELQQKVDEAETIFHNARQKSNGVPAAPFEKNWHELAMKRMLRLAAEEGFDKVAWTTGEQQAERYNMSKQVERIDVEDNGVEEFSDGTIVAKNVALRTANDNVVHLYVDADGVAHGREFDGKSLAEIVGKDLAEKIMQPGDFTIEGDGLRIGGEGMKGFYDKMLPSFVSKYTKKWGAKVGTVEMPSLEQNNVMHSVDVTPEMKESVMEGQTMFRVTQEALDVVNEFNTRNRNTARVIFADGEQDLREQLSAWDFTPEDIEVVVNSYKNGTLASYFPEYDKVLIYKHDVSQKELNGYLWHENAHRAVEHLFSQEEMEEIFLDMAGDKIEEERAGLLENGYEEAEQAEEYIVRVIEEMYLEKPAFVEQNRFKAVEGAREGVNRVIPKLKKIIDFIQNGNEEDSTRRGRVGSGLRRDKTEYQREVGRGDAMEMRNAGNKGGNAQETTTAGGAELLTSEAVQQEADRMDADEVVVTASAVKALAQKLNTNVNIVEDSNSLPENLRAKKGWYDPKTGEVVVVMDNHVSMEDALQTILHEIVGHHGLQVVLGDRMGEFLNFVYNNLPKNTKSRVNNYVISQNMKGNPMTQRQAVEEYIAELAERGFEGYNDLWNGIRQWFRDFFRNFMNIEVTDGELRYMLWKNYQRLQVPNVLTKLQERVMQDSTNTDDSGLMFRSTDGGIKAGYEKAVTGWWNKFKQGYYDQLRAVRKAQELIAKESGKRIKDSEDVYSFAEHVPSINKIMAEQFDMFYMKPFTELLKKLHDKMLGGVKIDDKMLERYANAKHGLERNREMAVKEALTSFEEVKGKKRAVLNEKGYDDWKGRKADILAKKELSWEEKQRELDKLAKTFGAKLGDYSGITAIFDPEGKMKYKELSELAVGYVNSMEQAIGKGNTDEFWKQIKGMTKYSLEQSYKSGLISKDTYDTISGLYSFYVPLRGFTEQTAEDIFDYVAVDHSPLSGVLKRAKGRTSEADNIFATIVNMAHSSIVMGNKNKMKQMALNLAMNHPTPLLSVDNAWYAKVGDEYIPQYPDIKEGMDEKAMADAFAEFEARMKEMEKNGEVVRHAPGLNIKERVVNSWNEQQHAIRVKRNGKEYVVWVNGSPTFANAINGMLKDNDKIVGMGWLDAVNSFRSKAVTQYSPTFVFTNLFRDVQSASMVYGVLRGRTALAKFEKNLGVNSVAMMKLYSKYKSDTLDMNNEQEKFFKEFLENGGETGYTEMISIEEYQKMLNKLTEKLNVKNATGRAFEAVGDGIEFANRCVENLSRFSAYMTSRQMGMSIMQSANDAKEVSVNFNRRGSGEMGAKVVRKWFMFFNPAVQSVAQRILLTGKYPKRMVPILAAELAAGAAMPYLFASLSALLGFGPDDEEDDTFEERFNRRLGNYYNLTDYRRRSSICFPTAEGMVNIPLSHEARVFFGLGELVASIMTGHEVYDNIPSQVMNVLGQSLPFNPVEGWNFGEGLGETLMYNLTPDAIKPFVEVGMNRDFAGNRIHNRTDYNRHLPEWMRGRKGTAEVYKAISRGLSGDESDFGKNVLDENIGALINPSNMEHLVKGYLGGAYTFLEKGAKSAQWALGDEEYAEFRNIPIVSSFYTSMSKYEEKPAKERTRRDWEDAFKYYQKEVGLLDNKEKAVKNGIKQNFNNAQGVLDAMKNDGDLLVVDVFNDGYKVIKELYSEADVARSAKDMERLNEINNEIYAHKRVLVERMEQMAENPLVGYDFLVGKEDTPYGRLETYGDLRDAQEINEMQKKLKGVVEEEKNIEDKTAKEYYKREHEKAYDLYDDLAGIERMISKIKKLMTTPEKDMGEIRKLRSEAMDLIRKYNE